MMKVIEYMKYDHIWFISYNNNTIKVNGNY